MSTNSKAYITAIKRTLPSAPMKQLMADNLIKGRSLDYGCGKGFDAGYYGMAAYDPHYNPRMPTGQFDTITCNYVLNVIESERVRLQILQDIQARLVSGGKAYITVRIDKRALIGKTKSGSWQCLVVLNLPVVHKGSGYIIYELSKTRALDLSIQTIRIYKP